MGVCSSENEDSGSYGGLTCGQAVSPLFPTLHIRRIRTNTPNCAPSRRRQRNNLTLPGGPVMHVCGGHDP